MQRLVEQPADEGDVFAGAQRIGRVHYHLAVYQHFADQGEVVGEHVDVEGRITPVAADVDVQRLHDHATELTLHLSDGRRLDFWIANHAGTIRSTGRGLYRS